ncbi:MAG: ABC transporter permease [Clostridium sp.]
MKIFSLTYNELVKQFKKPSIKIIISIILLAAIILPMGLSKFENKSEARHYAESNQYLLEEKQRLIDELKNDKSVESAVSRKIYEVEKEILQLQVDYKIGGMEDWRSYEAYELQRVSLNLLAIEEVLEGVSQDILLKNIYNVDNEEVAKYYDLTLAKKKEVEAKFLAEKQEIVDMIINNDHMKHTELNIKRKEAIIAKHNKDIADYEALAAKNPKDEEGKAKLESARKLMETAKVDIPQLEQDNVLLKFRFDNKIDYDKNNWKNVSIISIEKELNDFRRRMMNEGEFSVDAPRMNITMSYDEYVENFKATNNKRADKMNELWYGLENDIPNLNAIKDARSIIDGTYDIFVILAVIVVILIGGGIVSQEFSTGTVRLLLIRPVSRWKILLSKLLSLLIIGLGVGALSVIILIISSGATLGFETLQTPVIQTISGNVVEVDYINYMLPHLAVSLASLLFIIALVFTISTLSRNTALAVAISMLLYVGTLPIVMIVGSSLKQPWIVNTMIPYMNNSAMKLVPTTIGLIQEQSGIVINQSGGILQLLVVSVVMLVATFAIFIKKDIKN